MIWRQGKIRFFTTLFALLLLPSALMLSLRGLSLVGKSDTVLTQGQENSKVLTVILDPGHGGIDSGAVSDSGAEEKNLNLYLALSLAEILEASGVRVVLTRQDDRLLEAEVSGGRKMKDLAGRLQVMQEHPDAIFVSIHMNRFSSPECTGAQVWYAAGSKGLADGIARAIKESLQPENHRKSKQAGEEIYLLHRASSVAVLVECGFLSSPTEAELLCDGYYRDRLAAAIARGIFQFAAAETTRIE